MIKQIKAIYIRKKSFSYKLVAKRKKYNVLEKSIRLFAIIVLGGFFDYLKHKLFILQVGL